MELEIINHKARTWWVNWKTVCGCGREGMWAGVEGAGGEGVFTFAIGDEGYNKEGNVFDEMMDGLCFLMCFGR